MKLRKVSFKIISMIMVIAMMLGISATTISAVADAVEHNDPTVAGNKGDTNGDGTIKYVSIGDSMTNGYGFDGYNQDMHTINRDKVHLTPDVYNYFDGTGVYGNGSYALQFENYLKGIYGANNVDHTKLALSAFRPEDLLFLIDDSIDKHDQSQLPLKDGYFNNSWAYVWDACEDYDAKNPNNDYIANFDGYVWGHEPGTSCGASGYVAYHLQMKNFWTSAYPTTEKLYQQYETQFAELKSYFQNSLIDADVISLALGNAAFDAYFMDRLFMIWGDEFTQSQIWKGRNEITIADIKEQLCETEAEKAMVEKLYAVMQSVVKEKISDEDYSAMKMDRVCQLMTYVTFSYMYSYKQVIEWIGNNNPDAQVMIVGLLNSHHGITMTQDGEMLMDMGEGMGAIYDMMNTYVAGVASKYMEDNDDFTGKFLYVEQPENPEMIATVIGELDQAGWGLIDCGVAGCEDCANGKACENGRLDGEIVRVKTIPVFVSYFAKPMGYWYAGAQYTSGLFSSDMKLLAAVQNAIDSNLDVVTVAHNLMGTPNDSASPYWNTSTVAPLGVITANVIYLACEQAMVTALESSELEVEALVSYADGSMGTLLNSVDKTILPTNKPGVEGWADTLIPTVDEDGNAITLKYIYDYFYEFYTSDEMLPMMRFLAINKVGNGIAAHPTPANHDRLAVNMIAAYENGYTVQDKCAENHDIIFANEIYYTLSQKGLITTEQTNEIIDLVVDMMLGEGDQDELLDSVYTILFVESDITDEQRVEMIQTIYSALKENDYLNKYSDEKLSLIEELCAVLDEYATDEQIVAIVSCVYGFLADGEIADDEITEIGKYIYETVLRNSDLNDGQKVTVVGKIAYILKSNNYLNEYKAAFIAEELYNALAAEGLINDAQTFAIIDYVYDVVIDGEVTDEEIVDMIIYVYNLLIKSTPAAAYARTGGIVAPQFNENAAKTLRVVLAVVSENYLDDANKASVEKLITGDTALINDELLLALVENAVSIVENNKTASQEEIVKQISETSTDIVINDPSTDDATKLQIVSELTNVAKNNGLSGEVNELTNIFESYPVLKTIYTKLNNAGLFGEKEVMDIIKYLYNTVYGKDNLTDKEAAAVVVEIYDIVFGRESLTTTQKIDIVLIVYATLKAEGYITEENIKSAMDALHDLLVEYYDEAYTYAYNELYIAGYIAAAINTLGMTSDEIAKLAEAIEAMDLGSEHEELKALLVAEIYKAQSIVDEIAEAVANGYFADVEGLVSDLEKTISKIEELAANADVTVAEQQLTKALDYCKNLLAKHHEKVTEYLAENGKAIHDEFVEYVSGLGYEAAEWLYNWFMADPEGNIIAIVENATEIKNFLEKYEDEILTVIGFFVSEYDELVFHYALDNAHLVFPALCAWASAQGGVAYDLIYYYIVTIYANLDLDVESCEEIKAEFDKIMALLEELNVVLEDYAKDDKKAAIEAANDILKQLKDSINELQPYFIGEAKDFGNELYSKACQIVSEVVEDLTSGSFTPTEDTNFVSVNGGSAYYAELLAEYLSKPLDSAINSEFMTWGDLDYDKLAAADLITIGYDENELSAFAVAQLLAYVARFVDEDMRESIKAYIEDTLLTIADHKALNQAKIREVIDSLNAQIDAYVDDTFINNGYVDLNGKQVADMDWSKYVGAENVQYVEKALDRVKAELLASGVIENYTISIDAIEILFANPELLGTFGEFLDEAGIRELLGDKVNYTLDIPVIDAVMFAVESYLYSFVSFQAQYVELLADLYEINPDATIILVGQYNPFDVEFTLGDITLDLSEVYGYIVLASDVSPFVYALLSPNVAFVDVKDAETIYDEMLANGDADGTLLDFLLTYLADNTITDANEAGNVYIFECIKAILTVGCDHKYDNDCDAICNKCGAIREVAGHVYDGPCDEYCNVCGEKREGAGHQFSSPYCGGVCVICGASNGSNNHRVGNCEDGICIRCGLDLGAKAHTFFDCEDEFCCNCDYVRKAPGHKYDDCEDTECNNCGATRPAYGHVYATSCSRFCSVCDCKREEVVHVYSDCEDKSCNNKGCTASRGAPGHTVSDCLDTTCSVCGADVKTNGHKLGTWSTIVEPSHKATGLMSRSCSKCGYAEVSVIPVIGGISGGAVTAIVAASVLVAALGAFALYWFVLQKKTFADLKAVIVKPKADAPIKEDN